MAIKVSKQLNEALKDYKKVIEKTFNTEGSSKSYCAYISSIENEMRSNVNESFTLLNDWILPQLTMKDEGKNKDKGGNIDENEDVDITWDLLENVLAEFDKAFEKDQQGQEITHIRKHPKSKCRSALASFAKYILGMYKANLYLSLEQKTDEENCKIVARNALFCTIEIAKAIKKGRLGGSRSIKLNSEKITIDNINIGNPYFSWFCCASQRKKSDQKKGDSFSIPTGSPDPSGTGYYKLDDNSDANEAIKRAVLAGILKTKWMELTEEEFKKLEFSVFKDYMACHIWDKSCYDYRYHTSVFNLVLLPKSIGGLSDYCPAVKEILRYEAAMRFGVYPAGYKYKMSNKANGIYKNIKNDWRQPEEHQKALAHIKEFAKNNRSKKAENKLPQGM